MANASHASGSQTAVPNIDHTLSTIITAGTYVLKVDANDLTGAETLILTVRGKARVGGQLRTMYQAIYVGSQADPLKVSLPIVTAGEDVSFVLRQEGGAGRTYPWNVIKLG